MPALCMHFGLGLLHSPRLFHHYSEDGLLASQSLGWCDLACAAGAPGGGSSASPVVFTSTCEHISNHLKLSFILSYASSPWLHGHQDLPVLPPEHPRRVSPFPTSTAGEAAWQGPGCEAGRGVGGRARRPVWRWGPEGGRGSEAAGGPMPMGWARGLAGRILKLVRWSGGRGLRWQSQVHY